VSVITILFGWILFGWTWNKNCHVMPSREQARGERCCCMNPPGSGQRTVDPPVDADRGADSRPATVVRRGATRNGGIPAHVRTVVPRSLGKRSIPSFPEEAWTMVVDQGAARGRTRRIIAVLALGGLVAFGSAVLAGCSYGATSASGLNLGDPRC